MISLLITPLIARLAVRLDLVDRPSARKVHTKPIPRIGGVAICLAFFIPLVASLLCSNDLAAKILADKSLLLVAMGAAAVFLMGLKDDISPMRPGVKFAVQAAAALLAYAGGVRIFELQLPWAPICSLGIFSLPITIFWFLLVINAINLIDGLDGLAAGISLFVSLALLASSVMGGGFLVAGGFAALAGACMGFLRYNFNPASIFMGDSGSYFLGYMLAALSILGSMKSQATVAILIPVIALGFPLMDAILSPIRRFAVGKEPFLPDKNHIHHRLLKMGLSHRNAVLLLYGATIFLGLFALLLVHAQDKKAAVILLITGISICTCIHKLGYLEYLATDKIMGYLHDISDAVGLQKDRRTFLSHQIAIDETANTDQLWKQLVSAFKLLKIDQAKVRFNGVCFSTDGSYAWCGNEIGKSPRQSQQRVFFLELPLADNQKTYGTLQIKKDLASDPLSHCTLRRIEQLRQAIVRKLRAFEQAANTAEQKSEIECRHMQRSNG